MAFPFVLSMGWALLLSVFIFSSSNSLNRETMIFLSAAWGPVTFVYLVGKAKNSAAKKGKDSLHSQSGVPPDSKFLHWENNTGIALNADASTITVRMGDKVKTYKFSDVRKWWVVNAYGGHFHVLFKDIDDPEWRIVMVAEQTRNRWMEILRQAINEDGLTA